MTATPPASPPSTSSPSFVSRLLKGVGWFFVGVWRVLWNDKVPLLINIMLIATTAYIIYSCPQDKRYF